MQLGSSASESVSEVKEHLQLVLNKVESFKVKEAAYGFLKSQNRCLGQSLKEMKGQLLMQERSKSQTISDLESLSIQLTQRKQGLQKLTERNSQIQRQIQTERQMLKEVASHRRQIQTEQSRILKHNSQLSQVGSFCDFLSSSLGCFPQLKVELNDEVQELKGTIRVYVRIRTPRTSKVSNFLVTDNALKIERTNLLSHNAQSQFEFTFDHIFDSSSTQDSVFDEVSALIQNGIDGRNICVFSYGQTGSGKTFTLVGSQHADGLIPKSVRLVFDRLTSKQNGSICQGHGLSVSISQIYNEKLIDLLCNAAAQCLEKRIFLEVPSFQGFLQIYREAIKSRSVSFTKCNSESSRSHLIVDFRIQRPSKIDSSIQEASNLLFVDLAGSQRLSQSQVTGQQEKQAKYINSSLTDLGAIICCMKESNRDPCFRNTKLGMLLQKYFSASMKNIKQFGKSIDGTPKNKLLMLANISPDLEDLEQTINCLKFASRARESTSKHN